MARFFRALALILCLTPRALLAQQDATPGDDLKAIRQTLDQQSKQLDVLAQEIARLNLLLEGKTGAATAPPPEPDTTAPAAAAPPPIPVETAKPTPSGPVHIITRGETLTSIAKRYKVTVPALLKVNKIADVRKLQIGQTLALPPGAKIPESQSPSPQP